MKSPRMMVGGQWRGLQRTRAITLRGVKNLLTRIFNQTTPEQGVALDYSDLTDEKLMWRRNLLTETEFRNGLSDAPVRGGAGLAAASIAGYAGAIQVAYDAAGSYAYKQGLFVAGGRYTISVLVQMNDGNAPQFNSPDSAGPANDFSLVLKGDATSPLQYVITQVSGSVYRVSYTGVVNGSGLSNVGVVKYGGNNSRAFKVTGYQLERNTLSPYQALTDVSTELLAAFPTHSLYQDNLGQLAVFAPEQPIGFAADMRLGGFRVSAWNNPVQSADWTANGDGSFTHTPGNTGTVRVLSPGGSPAIGKLYEAYFTVTGRTAGAVSVLIGSGGGGPQVTANGRAHCFVAMASNTVLYIQPTSDFNGTVSNIVMNELPGNHATQASVGDRPILDGRVNRLQYSEQLSNAAWQKISVTVADNTDSGPDGIALSTVTGTAATTSYVQQAANIPCPPNTTVTYSAHIKAGTASSSLLRVYNAAISTLLASAVVNWTAGVPSIGSVAGPWTAGPIIEATSVPGVYRVSGQFSTGSQTSLAALFYPSAGNTADNAKVGGLQLNFGPLARYQRIGVATDYDAIGFPKGARFNGTNSWMSIANLDLSGSDKIGAVVSGRKDSDNPAGVPFELSPNYGNNNGTLAFFLPSTANIGEVLFAVRGTASQFPAATGQPLATPQVWGGVADIAAPYSAVRVNGATFQPRNASLGTGNFGSYTGYIGRRGGTSLPFNGVLYRIGVRSTLADNFIAMMERWASEPFKPGYINSLPSAAAVAPLDRVIILGASLETGAFGGGVNTQNTEIVYAQNRILDRTGKAVVIHQYAVSGQDLNGTVTTSWPKALSEQAALPGNGRTLVLIGSGGNTITGASRPLSASVIANARSQLLTMIDQIEAKGWDWCLFDLSWRNYSSPLNQYDRTQGSWPWITGVTRSINAARKKLWGRNWTYPDGASWGDLYALYRNNVQILADEVHPTDYLLTRNYVIDNVIIPAITGVPVDQRFIRDEAYALGFTANAPTVSGTVISLTAMATHQGTLHMGLYASGSTPTAAEVVAGGGTGFVSKTTLNCNGTTIDQTVVRSMTAPGANTTYTVCAVFVSDARQTSAVLSGNVTTGASSGGGATPVSPVVLLLRQDTIANARANINQLSSASDLTSAGVKLTNMVRLDGTQSGLGYTQVSGFNQVNAAGQSANFIDGYFVPGELNQSWYVDNGTASVNLTGFTPGQTYQVLFAANRDVPSTDTTRTGDITITSGTVTGGIVTQTLNAANPPSGITAASVTFLITAPANGVIAFQFKRTAGNSGFGYIGGIHIRPAT